MQYKYPDVSPYVYCAGNPVKYVDPDGRWIWENKNIQEARHYASDWGCSVRLVDGKYGKDAQIVNAHGDVIDTKPATAGNQHCAFVNIVNTLDEGGISHAGGTTYTTKQDVAVATGVIGVISGGMALEAAGTTAVGTAVTVAGMLNSADDIGTNTKGESLLQQQSTTETGKNIVGGVKNAVGIITTGSDISTILTSSNTYKKLISVSDMVNNAVNTINSLLNEE